MKIIFTNSLYQFVYNEQYHTLIFQWSSETQSMNDEDFKEALSNFSGYVSDFPNACLLIDTTQLKFKPSPKGGSFRNESCLPRFMASGSFKLAYVVPAEARSNMPSDEVVTDGFTDNFFTSREDAFEWLASKK